MRRKRKKRRFISMGAVRLKTWQLSVFAKMQVMQKGAKKLADSGQKKRAIRSRASQVASPPLTVCSQSAAQRPRQAWTGHACLQSASYFFYETKSPIMQPRILSVFESPHYGGMSFVVSLFVFSPPERTNSVYFGLALGRIKLISEYPSQSGDTALPHGAIAFFRRIHPPYAPDPGCPAQ